MKVYVMVSFPEIQDFMEHPRWNECIFCQSIEGHECPDSTYMVPKDLYEGIESYAFAKDNLGKTFLYEGREVKVVGHSDEDIIVEYLDCDMGWSELDDNDVLLIPADVTGSLYYVGPEDLEEKIIIKSRSGFREAGPCDSRFIPIRENKHSKSCRVKT